MPFFSVVIPLYNKRNYVAAAIESVLAQTISDFELLIVDDASTDKSADIAKAFTDDRIRLINHEHNKGLSAARNTGIREARADYIAFLDADDTWKPAFLETILQLINNYPEASVFATKYEEVHPGGRRLEHHFDVPDGLVDNFFLSNLNQSIYNYSCVCIAKEAFERAGYFNENINFAEDVDFNIRLHLTNKMAYSNIPLACYAIHSENQITRGTSAGKVITDFDRYERENPTRADLKKYLDFKRYVMAKRYRLEGNSAGYKAMVISIDKNNLNGKQRLLLQAPSFVLRGIQSAKKLLLKLGLNPTTY